MSNVSMYMRREGHSPIPLRFYTRTIKNMSIVVQGSLFYTKLASNIFSTLKHPRVYISKFDDTFFLWSFRLRNGALLVFFSLFANLSLPCNPSTACNIYSMFKNVPCHLY